MTTAPDARRSRHLQRPDIVFGYDSTFGLSSLSHDRVTSLASVTLNAWRWPIGVKKEFVQ
jgi:hypothetical protein